MKGQVGMSSAIGILWTLLSIVVAGVCSFSFMQPIWVIHPVNHNALGVYGYCVQDPRYKDFTQVCGIYGGFFHFSNLPSSSWQAACVLFGGGSMIMCLSALLASVTLCVPKVFDRRIALVTGYVQTIAVMTLVLGVVVYPMGLDSRFVDHYCPGSGSYNAGECHIGWGYMLAIVGTALSIFCPFLSQYTNMKLIDDGYL